MEIASCSTELLQVLIFAGIVKKFSFFHGTRKFITIFKKLVIVPMLSQKYSAHNLPS
jgi:hypothetical protein